MVFDLLWLDGEDVYRLPWSERRAGSRRLASTRRVGRCRGTCPGDDLTDVYEATKVARLETGRWLREPVFSRVAGLRALA
jgi:ATP-dependent DNA ligase